MCITCNFVNISKRVIKKICYNNDSLTCISVDVHVKPINIFSLLLYNSFYHVRLAAYNCWWIKAHHSSNKSFLADNFLSLLAKSWLNNYFSIGVVICLQFLHYPNNEIKKCKFSYKVLSIPFIYFLAVAINKHLPFYKIYNIYFLIF